MTSSDDKLSRRYRDLPREEPSPQVDDLILAASRRAVSAGPQDRGLAPESAREGSRRTGARPQWMVPVSIAAVLVLGIGVSLRMQLEQPGIESSVPSTSSNEYSVPPDAEPAPKAKLQPEAQSQPVPEAPPPAQARARSRPEPEALARQDTAPAQSGTRAPAEPVAKPLAKKTPREAEAYAPKGFAEEKRKDAVLADTPIVLQSPAPASPPVVILPSAPPPPASATAAAPARVEAPARAAAAPRPQSATPAASGAPPQPAAAPALRAKREAVAADSAAARESRTLGATAEPDPVRELERIARLREAARHEEADRALAEFRRNHPDYRIPEAMWERVRAR